MPSREILSRIGSISWRIKSAFERGTGVGFGYRRGRAVRSQSNQRGVVP